MSFELTEWEREQLKCALDLLIAPSAFSRWPATTNVYALGDLLAPDGPFPLGQLSTCLMLSGPAGTAELLRPWWVEWEREQLRSLSDAARAVLLGA